MRFRNRRLDLQGVYPARPVLDAGCGKIFAKSVEGSGGKNRRSLQVEFNTIELGLAPSFRLDSQNRRIVLQWFSLSARRLVGSLMNGPQNLVLLGLFSAFFGIARSHDVLLRQERECLLNPCSK